MYSDLTLVGTYGFIKYLNGFQKIQGNAVFCIAIVDVIIIVILSIGFFMDKLILDVPDNQSSLVRKRLRALHPLFSSVFFITFQLVTYSHQY